MRRMSRSGDERDAYSKFRSIHGYLQRAGAVKKIKKRTHRRERREARRQIDEGLSE